MANEFQGYSNMMNMQERAAERVRRMQMMQDETARRANEELKPQKERPRTEQHVQGAPDHGAQQSHRTSMPVEYLHKEKTPSKSAERKQHTPAPLLGGDQDSAMLLSLILLLSRETSDPSLILALMYIMM